MMTSTWTHGLWILMMGTLSFAACGGGSSSGNGGGGAGGSGASTSTGSGGSSTLSTSSTSSGTGGTTSTTGEGGSTSKGIACIANGTPHSFPDVFPSAAGVKGMSFTSAVGKFPQISFTLPDAKAVGTYTCAAGAGVGWVEFDNGPIVYTTALPGGSCTIDVAKVATGAGDNWVGTFSATVPQSGGTGKMDLTQGTFDIVY